MKRILLDEHLDHLLKELFSAEVDVRTVSEEGWNGKKNGELLRLANRTFDVFVTMDKNLERQQNLQGLRLSIIVVRARNNAYSTVAPLMSKVDEATKKIQEGEVVHISS